MRWILLTLALLAAVIATRGTHYAGGHSRHNQGDDQGIYCNFYGTDANGDRTVESVLCRYGCCGSINDQECCDNDGSDEDDDEHGGGRSVTFALVGILAMAILAVLVSCVLWSYKKSRANRFKTCHSDRFRPTTHIPGRGTRRQRNPTAPVHKDTAGDLSRAQIYTMFTIPTPPPSYAYPSPQPPAYDASDPPPYSPRRAGNKDELDLTVKSPPPPYS